MQLALFGNPVERFLLSGELPDEADEADVTEAIYAVAVNLRSSEPNDFERYEYTPPIEQEATMSSVKNDFSHGFHAGYHNIVSMLLANKENESFRLGFAAGRDAKLGEHPYTGSVIFESPGQSAYARRGRVGN